MNIQVITEQPHSLVTLTYKNSLTAPIVQETDDNGSVFFNDVTGSHTITTNDKIISTITEIVD